MPDHLNSVIKSQIEKSKDLSKVVRPEFLRLQRNEDTLRFNELLQSGSITILDSIKQQLAELIKINALPKKVSDEDLEDYISSHVGETSLNEYGVWLYYPWLNKLMHILDEEEFIRVRTNRNQHKITNSEIASLGSKKIGVIGLSVGQSIAITIALERICGEVRLADFDTLELSNLNRIKTSLHNLGVEKVVQAAREIAELDPYIQVVCYSEGITENNIEDFLLKDGKLDLLIEECDSLDIKILSRLRAKEQGIPVVMETNDRGMIDIERFDLDNNYPLLHGILEGTPYKDLTNLTTEQKVPMMMKLVGFSSVSARGKATLIELGQSLATWPQLASSVVLGAGVVTDVVRRILLNQLKTSGRFYVDIEGLIKDENESNRYYTPPLIKSLSVTEMAEQAQQWNFLEEDLIKPSADLIKKIVRDAGTAPSSGNDQPWRFLYDDGLLFLFHEASRSFSFGDFQNIASYMSLGGAIENLVLSTHMNGLEIISKLFPLNSNNTCIAVFGFKNTRTENTENHQYDYLYNYIHLRCTNRKVVSNVKASEDDLKTLKEATESILGAEVYFKTTQDDLQTLGRIISACDRIRVMHPQGHYDFFHREMRWSKAEAELKKTGMEISSLEINPQARIALDVIKNDSVINLLRDINGLQAFKWVSIPNAINSAAMGLITMPNYTPADFVLGGRAAQRQWLKATEMGYAYHPMIVPLYLFPRVIHGRGEGLDDVTIAELNDLRKQFLEIFPGDSKRGEIFLFRLFKADDIKERSLRLPVEEILDIIN